LDNDIRRSVGVGSQLHPQISPATVTFQLQD